MTAMYSTQTTVAPSFILSLLGGGEGGSFLEHCLNNNTEGTQNSVSGNDSGGKENGVSKCCHHLSYVTIE